jgi:hypothetical protein
MSMPPETMNTSRFSALVLGLLAIGSLASKRADAQPSIFQVPSGKLAPPLDVTAQQQTSLTSRLDFSLQAVTGLPWGGNAGVALYNVTMPREGNVRFEGNHTDRNEPFGPLVLVSLQQRIPIGGPFSLAIGNQTGPNIGPAEDTRVATRGYINAVAEWRAHSRCSAGAYVANGIFLGGATVQAAPWLGCEVEVIDGVLVLRGDWDFGAHAKAGVTVGPQLLLGKHVGISVGARAPNPWASSQWAGVLQFELSEPFTD